MALQARRSLNVWHKHTKSLDDRNAVDELTKSWNQEYTSGKPFYDKRGLAGGANESLDLYGGLVDGYSNYLNYTVLHEIAIKNLSESQNLTIGNAANPVNIFGAGATTIDIPPGDIFCLSNHDTGWTVTAGSADEIKVALAAGDAAYYEIWLLGSTA